MAYILEDFENNILNYFDRLRYLGASKAQDPVKLLTVDFIDCMLKSEMSQFITESDYKDIDKALNCFFGGCLIPFESWKSSVTAEEGIGNLNLGFNFFATESGLKLLGIEDLLSILRIE